MATPAAAGIGVLIRVYMVDVESVATPSGALIKALLISGAVDVGTQNIPNNNEGWGRVDLDASIYPTSQSVYWDDKRTLSTSQTYSYFYQVTAGQAFRVTLVWSDYEAQTTSTTQMVNNLDLEVIDPQGTTYKGNSFSGGQSVSGGNADALNPTEMVLVKSPGAGVWEVKVVGTSVNVDSPCVFRCL